MMPLMPPTRSPLADTERLIIDGSNLLHALRRGAAPAPAATLIGRLRGIIEPGVRIELIFDGPQEQGLGDTRIASGVSVRYSGRYTADSVIAKLVAEAVQPVALLVVTDDAELTDRVKRVGGRTARTEWLMARLSRSRLESPSIGRPRPPAGPANTGRPARTTRIAGDGHPVAARRGSAAIRSAHRAPGVRQAGRTDHGIGHVRGPDPRPRRGLQSRRARRRRPHRESRGPGFSTSSRSSWFRIGRR